MAIRDLSDFELERAAFEVRYDLALLHWDRAGAIWTEVRRRWPGADLMEAEPGKTSFVLERDTQLTLQLKQANVTTFKPDRNLKSLAEVSSSFLEIIVRHLEITAFSRVGLRFVFFMETPDAPSAAQALVDTKLLRIPDDAHFSTKGAPHYPEYALRWEGDAVSAMVKIQAIERLRELKPTPGNSWVPRIDDRKYGITFDLDYFTRSSVMVGQLHVPTWYEQALHVLHRDSKKYFGG